MTSDDGDSRWEHCHLAAVPAQRFTCSSNGLGSAAPVHAAVLNVQRNHKVYQGQGEGGNGVWRWGKRQIIIIHIATLSPPE